MERVAGLILLAVAGLFLVEAASSVVQAMTRRAEEGEAELVALGQLGAVVFGVGFIVFLFAAVGVLRDRTWGRRLGLVLSGFFAVVSTAGVVTSPMPWDDSANLGIYQTGWAEWLLGFIEIAALWIALAALIRARRAPSIP